MTRSLDSGTLTTAGPSRQPLIERTGNALKLSLPAESPAGDAAGDLSQPNAVLARLMDIARASALEEMASGLAHELNQPLGAIATYSQAMERMLAKSPPMIDAALDAARQISKEALGAGEGIRRIRKLFHRESLRKERCSIGAILLELQPLLRLLGERNNAQLSINIAPGIPDAHADPLRVQHVLFTLIQNAFEAKGEGEREPQMVKVTVGSDRYSVEVAVKDNGAGIPDEFQDQIFKPFYTTKPNGTGLGLASSRAVVEMHEGSIGFKSSPKGSRFWFSLPAYPESKGLDQS